MLRPNCLNRWRFMKRWHGCPADQGNKTMCVCVYTSAFSLAKWNRFHGRVDKTTKLGHNPPSQTEEVNECIIEPTSVQTNRRRDDRMKTENTDLLFSVSSSSLVPSLQHSSFSFLIREFWELSRPSSSPTATSHEKSLSYSEVNHFRWCYIDAHTNIYNRIIE